MAFDYSKLRGRIVEKYGTLGNFETAIGFSHTSLSNKMLGKSDWSNSEIVRACNLLDVKNSEVGEYFFCVKS